MTTDVDNLSNEILNELNSYSEEIEKKIDENIDKITNIIVNDLKNDDSIPKKTGKYKRSFFAKTRAEGRGYKRNVIGNKKYQLTQLLEYGHAKRGGAGRVRAFPHWKHAEEKAEKLLDEVVKKL